MASRDPDDRDDEEHRKGHARKDLEVRRRCWVGFCSPRPRSSGQVVSNGAVKGVRVTELLVKRRR